MAAKNSVTGDLIQTKNISDEYRNNYDVIFGKKLDSPIIILEKKIIQDELVK